MNLTELANHYGSDKGNINKDAHYYTRIYEALFAPIKNDKIKILEIGLLHPHDERWSSFDDAFFTGGRSAAAAPSLNMWLDYFRNAQVFGFDINDFSSVHLDRCVIVRGNSADREDLARIAAHGPFDIIIDDASHASIHQQAAFGALFSSIKPGGLYIIEDLQWQPPQFEAPDTPKTRDMLSDLASGSAIESPHISSKDAVYIQRTYENIVFYDSISPANVLGGNDALAVIKKRLESSQ